MNVSPALCPRRGFTLVEVLIGILVFGLGLLGLASVIPAAFVQQRQASDAIQGEAALDAASTTLQNDGRLNLPVDITNPYDGRWQQGWNLLLTRGVNPANDAQFLGGNGFSRDGQWIVSDPDGGVYLDVNGEEPGTLVIGLDGLPDRGDPDWLRTVGVFTANSRLFPLPRVEGGTTGDEPRFVWDVALRRVFIRPQPADPNAARIPSARDRVQAAIFVRRIDTGIRRTGADPTLHQRFRLRGGWIPVACDDEGRPLFNGGNGRVGDPDVFYSPIEEVAVEDVLPEPGEEGLPPRAVITDGRAEIRGFFEQVGQFMVTQSGRVVRVRGVGPARDANDRLILTLDKPLDTDGQGVESIVLMTTQLPAGVRVITLGSATGTSR